MEPRLYTPTTSCARYAATARAKADWWRLCLPPHIPTHPVVVCRKVHTLAVWGAWGQQWGPGYSASVNISDSRESTAFETETASLYVGRGTAGDSATATAPSGSDTLNGQHACMSGLVLVGGPGVSVRDEIERDSEAGDLGL